MLITLLFALLMGNVGSFYVGSASFANAADAGFEEWILKQRAISTQRLLQNIHPQDARPGVVIASPSRENPDYYFHWVRDAALTMDTVADFYDDASGDQKQPYLDLLLDFAGLSRENQLTPTLSGLGEPKFYVDGRAFDGPWGRPQNDGPALRALTLIRTADRLLALGRRDQVAKYLYDGRLPTQSVIKTDLEFVAHHWSDPCFDLWEEVKGDHYYTRLVQLTALRSGARLAYDMNDRGAASFYDQQAQRVEASLSEFWQAEKGFLGATLRRVEGVDYKSSNLDLSVVLAHLHVKQEGADSRVLATAAEIERSFRPLYSVNSRVLESRPIPGFAIGRYPEDRYYDGNPWVLTTLGLAELYYRTAAHWLQRGTIPIDETSLPFFHRLGFSQLTADMKIAAGNPLFIRVLEQMETRADDFIRRVRVHANPDGSLSEQIHRESGFMESARDLTWSHASFLTATRARAQYLTRKNR
ncbi:MAG: glycoside hydrolase family 15 protein [Bacteriovoracia bacterium]